MEKFLENLEKAEKIVQTTDHMIYVTFPLFKDKRLLLKILLEIKIAVSSCINSILQYEYLYKKISLYKDPKTNFRTFEEECAPRYKISKEDIRLILELFDLVKKHKESPFEFIRNEKIVILSEDLRTRTLTIEKIKRYLILTKDILRKTKQSINSSNLR
ncbi:hypothetical protein CMI40_02100 [Candidatus Pacearchaeota archaeon]|jgi:hypothetical protein|nr:hypothetical protein [Candidatus Pacearchaeota archaeon]|tara:strand:+ start:1371 stop:1847 length:477 start_codon:yes stop_codon:yes gene_type:complete